METLTNNLENLFQEKIETYQLLVDMFIEEKKSLEDADVDALWKFSDKKQNISTRIAEIRLKILAQLTKAGISHDMNATSFHSPKIISLLPQKLGRKIQKNHVSLITIKKQIHNLSEGNKKFVEDYLGILDELIGIITNSGKPEPEYNPKTYGNREKKTNLLLHREV